MGSITVRVRSLVWFVSGAMVATAVMVMFANAWRVDAAPGDDDATFVGVTPCRLADTRPAPNRVGPADTLGAGETQSFAVVGSNGECTIPGEAVAVSLNVTALGASELSFLTFWPDGDRPLAASLNPAPGQPPVPNAVTVDLSDVGGFNVFNASGTVDVVIDINGYYTQASLKELAERLAAVEAAQAAGVDPAVLARLGTLEATSDSLTAGVATNSAGIAELGAAQPFTVASEPIASVTAETAVTEIRNVSVTAPVAGQVAVIASGDMFEATDGQYVRCGLMQSVTDPPVGRDVYWQSPTGGDNSHLSASRVFDIAAGQTATYHLVCNNANGGTSRIFSPQVTAIFTPAP